MRSRLLTTITACLLLLNSLQGQDNSPPGYRNFPIIFTLNFHAFSMPFKQLNENLKHIGFGIGTEFSYSGKADWVQEIQLVWYRNRAVGNGLFLSTQMAWRPDLTVNIRPGVRAGIGYWYSFRPSTSYVQKDGAWTPADKKGKGMLAVPVGISLAYHRLRKQSSISPFAAYQLILLTGYSTSIPIVPETLIQVGGRYYPGKN